MAAVAIRPSVATKPFTVLSIPFGADTGGTNYAIGHAFRNVEGWTWHSVISTRNSIAYPVDLQWDRDVVWYWWKNADVVHLHHNILGAYRVLHGWKGLHLPRRPFVLHFHGTGFRTYPKQHIAEMRRWHCLGLVSTLDLWLLAPDRTEWLPCPVQRRPRTIRNDGMVRIAHAPTNREVKGTAAFLAAIERLQEEGLPVELDLIEGVTWRECLQRKAQADIYYDQVQLGYGNNAIEAWGMGIPVVAGAQPETLAEMRRRFGELPFYRADESTIYDALKALVLSEDLRAEYTERGLNHVGRYHDEQVVVEQLKDVYRRAVG